MSSGREHWTNKGPVKLFLWEKSAGASPAPLGTILFVHGSSMAGTPTFDLQVPGRPDSSAMDHFASSATTPGAWTWRATAAPTRAGRSTRTSPPAPTTSRRRPSTSAHAGRRFVSGLRHLVRRAAGGALRPAPPRARARGWRSTRSCGPGRGAPRWPSARKRLPEFQAKNRRPIDRAFVRSIFTRDHPGTADDDTIEAFADGDPRAGRLGADRHLRGHVREPADRRSRAASRCRPSSCAGSTTASRRSTTSSSSSRGCRIRTSSSPSCPGSPTPASSRRTTDPVPHPPRLLQPARADLPRSLGITVSRLRPRRAAPARPGRSGVRSDRGRPGRHGGGPEGRRRSPGTPRRRSRPPRRSPTCSRPRPASRSSCFARADRRCSDASCRRSTRGALSPTCLTISDPAAAGMLIKRDLLVPFRPQELRQGPRRGEGPEGVSHRPAAQPGRDGRLVPTRSPPRRATGRI